jgi:hypothetical protein
VKSAIALVALGGVCGLFAACGETAPPPPAATSTPIPAGPAPVAAARPAQPAQVGAPAQPGAAAPPGGQSLVPAAPAVPGGNVPQYADKGRKDPFVEVQISASTGGLSVATTKLTGIVRGPRSTLALVETQEGIGYILKPGDTLGDGRLMEIGADNVVFAVAPKLGSAAQRVVLRLAAN